MGLDIALFRVEGGNPDMVRESQRRRGKDVTLVDQVIDLDNRWKACISQRDHSRMEKNSISKETGAAKKAGKDTAELVERSKNMDARIKQLEQDAEDLLKERDAKINLIGNIVHEDVPVSNDEANNRVEVTWGETRKPVGPTGTTLEHGDLLEMIGGVDMVRGAKVAGHRGYFLRGVGVRLNMALERYAIDFLDARGYSLISTPLFMNCDLMGKTAQLEEYDETLYKVEAHAEDDAKYLIATSEQPISAYHAGEWLQPKELPIRYAGLSACFRKEAGSGGKDQRGIFRVHIFSKVEQFCIVEPEKSWEEHARIIQHAEEFFQSLGLAYQVINIVSGALNNAAAKKLDLEVWFPQQDKYRELVSASNCLDYQSRGLEVRCGSKVKGEAKKYVHMLNATLMANTRSICAILENYQTPEGIVVPDVLRPYLNGLKLIPYIRTHEEILKEKKI